MTTEPTIAAKIRAHLTAIKSGRRDDLIFAYNWATSPSRMMTDREARACQKLARIARRRLAGLGGWHENENGRLVPVLLG